MSLGLDKIYSELRLDSSVPAEPAKEDALKLASTEPVVETKEVAPVAKELETSEDQVPLVTDSKEDSDEWDIEVPDGTVIEDTKVSKDDFSFLKDVAGKEFSKKEDVATYIKSLKEENESLKSSSNDIDKFAASLPKDLSDAIRLYKDNGDYLSYLKVSEVNYDVLSDQEIIEFTQRDLFNEGAEGDQEFQEYIESKKPVEIKLEAKKIRNELKHQQQLALNKIENDAKFRKAENEKSLRAALDSKSEVRGFKLNEKHKKALYDSIVTGEIQKDLFIGDNGKVDFGKVVDVYFSYKYADKIDSFYKSKIQNTTKRQMLDDLSNTDLSSKGQLTGIPESKNAFDKYFEKLKKK